MSTPRPVDRIGDWTQHGPIIQEPPQAPPKTTRPLLPHRTSTRLKRQHPYPDLLVRHWAEIPRRFATSTSSLKDP
ncbi:hypothetical protein N658DRAFT_212740 [Parathielavia hyrcaniae]|uniref:Uncharacterized protein n=1 Tax=Parathielavia hyrcaniae TaxID=113614 RepID=A0AAN6Q0C4_9PEZI|nr:hypothetical protein N658DRAFT_212740 [Parathielavia hyrcaniae]